MKRNQFLDVIKGICILLVILTHFDWVESERLKYFFPYWMNPAVPIFMIVSGYVFTESSKRKKISTFRQAYSLKYVTDKIIRYTVPFILIYTMEIFLQQLLFNEIPNTKMLLRQLFWAEYGPGSYYYPCMLQFIFLFPLIYFTIRKWDFNGLLLCGLVNIFYEVIKVPLQMSGEVFRVLVFRYIFAISLGCYFSIGKKKLNKWMGITSFVFGAVFIYAVCYGGYKPVYFSRWSRTSMLAVFYIAPIAYLLIKKCNWECKLLALLGRASYNVYFVQIVYFYMGNRYIGGISGTFYWMLISYVVCILAGLLFYQIETPITKKILAWNAKILEHRELERSNI